MSGPQNPTHRHGGTPLSNADIASLLEDDTAVVVDAEDTALFGAAPPVVNTLAASAPVTGERAVSPLSDDEIENLLEWGEVTTMAHPAVNRVFLAGGVISSSSPQDLDLIARPATPAPMPLHVLADVAEDFFSAAGNSAVPVAAPAPAPTRRVNLSEVPVQPLYLNVHGRKMMTDKEIDSEENKKSGIAFGERGAAIFAQRKGGHGAGRGGK